ncbi:ammonium transporter [Novosphingobium aquimarinum]|uniref:ammonium transporter n=1 Tax=Novosphingobium aquimarinum TaxID=2682494 RepID=UPI001E4676C1|nr:ammonium transporter [Novosphingobium aquimarinum]
MRNFRDLTALACRARSQHLLLGTIGMIVPGAALAQDGSADVSNAGDTAWVLAASLIALFASVPGIALFHAGRSASKNALSVVMQTGAIAAAVSLAWIVSGYTIAFGDVGNGWIGSGNAWMLITLGNVRAFTEIPESAFAFYQIVLAMLASAILAGAWADRARFGFAVVAATFWSLTGLAPVSHWVRGSGWIYQAVGTVDYAGGLSVLFPTGVSALVFAAILGKPRAEPTTAMLPFSSALTLLGALIVWTGMLALAGAAAFIANDDAAAALICAHAAACAGGLGALLADRLSGSKPSASGFARGVVCGLAASFAGAPYLSPGAAILIGLLAALAGRGAAGLLRRRLAIHDTLDVFAIFAVPAATGALLAAIFQSESLGGVGYDEGMNMIAQLVAQVIALGVITAWATVVTAIVAVATSLFFQMRVGEEAEASGLDVASHGEHA